MDKKSVRQNAGWPSREWEATKRHLLQPRNIENCMKRVKPPKRPAQKKEPKLSATRMKSPEAYYDVGRQCYWIQDCGGNWITVNETSLKRQLKACGFSASVPKGERLSALDRRLIEIQLNRDVAYAGPLAGYKMGLIEICGERILVTRSPKLITPVNGEWPTIRKLQENLFGQDQLPYVRGWEKIAVESLRAGHLRPGQILVLAGETGCGKSLYQNLITELLGGRTAKPYRYMTGGTDFNAELFGAEHLMIEDESASTDIRSRRHFGARCKDFTVNAMQSCHAKGRQALSLKPFWRVSVSVNDEPENLSVLPPLDDSLKDKIMLLKANKAPMPMPTETLQQREEFWQTLLNELPAYLWYLTHWKIPKDLKCERFGISHFHHPDLLEALSEISPEEKLLALIDEYLRTRETQIGQGVVVRIGNPEDGFRGTAESLQTILCTDLSRGFAAKQLLSWPNAMGTYLGRLAKKYPERVSQIRTADQRIWHITPPPAEAVSNGQVGESNADLTNQIIAASQGKSSFDAPTG
jgi:hypothetical protein